MAHLNGTDFVLSVGALISWNKNVYKISIKIGKSC